MLKFNIKTNIDSMIKRMSDIEKQQVPFALSQTLNDLAAEFAVKMQSVQRQTYDSPTPFTVNSFSTRGGKSRFMPGGRATKRKLISTVTPGAGMKGPNYDGRDATRRMNQVAGLQTEGGIKLPYKRKIPIPSPKARLNKYGNIPNKSTQNGLANLIAKKDTFIGGQGRAKHLRDGVYQRMKNGKLKPLIFFEDRASYRRNLPTFTTARRIVKSRTQILFRNRFRKALLTAR